jgi:hypothetical protein
MNWDIQTLSLFFFLAKSSLKASPPQRKRKAHRTRNINGRLPPSCLGKIDASQVSWLAERITQKQRECSPKTCENATRLFFINIRTTFVSLFNNVVGRGII